MRAIVSFALLTLTQIVPVAAEDQWREFRSDSDGFSVALPQTPVITSRRVGTSNATQTMFLIESGQVAYLVSMIQLEKDKVPKNPGNAYFTNLLKNYVDGSKTTLRTSRPATVSGQPGIEGISDTGNSTHITQVTTHGDRIYMLVYVGAKGQESGPDATRFRQSFKLLN
jgi:hypothetical protein